jgi:ribosome assembly protein RRB1
MVAGSQAEKKTDNRIYVMKWSEMLKTNREDEVDSDMNSDEELPAVKEPNVRYESIPHRGGINRIRSMYGSPIVATWNEDAEVGIYDVTPAIEELDTDQTKRQKMGKVATKSYAGTKLASCKHKNEGYALDWSPMTFGRLATGSCNAELNLF